MASADPASLNETVDDVASLQGSSPGAKLIRSMEASGNKYIVEDTVKPVKLFQRPLSSGDEVAAPLNYQMRIAERRSVRLKRLTVPKAQLKAAHTPPSDPPIANQTLQCPTTRGKDTASAIEQQQNLVHGSPYEGHALNGAKDKHSISPKMNFTPVNTAQVELLPQLGNLVAAVTTPEEPSTPMVQQVLDSLDDLLPSIEDDTIGADDTLVEEILPSTHDVIPGLLSEPRAEPKPHTQIQPPAPGQTPVLNARIVKRPPLPSIGPRHLAAQRQPRPMATAACQPSEEDLFFLLMSRNRRANDRQRDLEAANKKLQAQNHHLHEQGRTHHQQLAASNARSENQTSEIRAYKTEIEEFKSRFTKIKAYARDLAKDTTAMGAKMREISSTTDDLVRDKEDVKRSLESLQKISASAGQMLASLKPMITDVALKAAPIQQALHIAEERVRVTNSSLQHERLRNNRIETQMLSAQQLQERLSLSSMQEYRKAAVYIDDLCQAVLHLDKTVTKKQQPKFMPGMKQCIHLLQAMVEKQGTNVATMVEAKTVINTISERLLSYHSTAEKAAQTAASNGEQLSKDVLAQIATSLGSIGPSIGTEVNFATLRARIEAMKASITLGSQMVNLAYESKNTSEQREKEQSRRFDKLIEQLSEARKQPEPRVETPPAPKPCPDVPLLIAKYTQANSNYQGVQPKLQQTEEQLRQKSLEVIAVNEKLRKLQVEHEASGVSLTDLQGKHHKLQEDADAAVRGNIALKEQLQELEAASLQAAKVPALLQRLANRDAEIKRVQEEARKIPALVQDVASREAELGDLRPKIVQLDSIASQNLVYQSDIHSYKSTIQTLEQKVAKLEPLQNENTALKTEAANVQKSVQSLQSKLKATEHARQQVETLKKQISTLTIKWGDYDQLKTNLTAQKDAYAKQATQLDDLQSKLENAKILAGQLPKLQDKLQQLSQKCGNLNQQLDEGKKVIEKCETLQNDVEQRDNEITFLKTKLQQAEEAAKQLSQVQEESRKKETQVAALQEEITKLRVDSQKLQALQADAVYEDEYPTQQTMLDLAAILHQDEQTSAPRGTSAILAPTPRRVDFSHRGRTDRSSGPSSNTRRTSLRLGPAHETEAKNSQEHALNEIPDPQQIPDSQPQNDVRDFLATSSPLSSYGGDAMLLEDFEAVEGTINDTQAISQNAEMSASQLQSQKHAGYGNASSRTIITRGGRLQSGLSSQVIKETESQEQRAYTPNDESLSPAGPPRHLPNSAIKRPRVDPIEAAQSTQASSKRLRRTPTNLEVRTPKRPMSSSTQITEPDTTRGNRVSLPSGSRKGSVISANAPAPGKTQGGRKSRKVSKSDKYSQRFNHE